MATSTQEILAEADQLLQTVKNEEAPTEDTPFYGESSKEADAFLSGLRGTISKEQPQIDSATVSGFSPEVMKLLQESEDLIKGYSTGSPFVSGMTEDSLGQEERSSIPSPVSATPTVPTDPDSFWNRTGRSFNEFQKSAAEGVGVFARLTDIPELEQWAISNAKEQEEDIKSYGVPRRTSSITKRYGEVVKDYETEGVGAALESGGLLLQDMVADALGSVGPTVAAGLAAIPVAAVGGPVLGVGTALILPFMVGGLAGTGQVKEEAIRLGATPERADEYAAVGGAVVGILDKIGASLLLKSLVSQFGKKAISDELGKTVGKDVAKSAVEKGLIFAGKVAKGGARGGISEGSTETLQEAAQIAAAGLAADKTAIPYEGAEYVNRLIDAGALGVVGGSTLGSGTSGLGAIVQKQSANKALELEDTLDQVAKGIKDDEAELGGPFAATQKGIFGRDKSSKPMENRPIVSGLMKSALSVLNNFSRRGEGEARIVNLFANNAANISAAVGQDADQLQPIFRELRRTFRIPGIQRAIPKSVSRRVFKVMTTGELDGDARIDQAATSLRKFLGNAPVDPNTGRVKLPVKLNKKTVENAVFGEEVVPGSSMLGEDVQNAYNNGDIDQQTVIGLDSEVQALRSEYAQRLQAAPNEEAAIKRDIINSDKFKDLSNRQVYQPVYDGFYDRLNKAGIQINFEEGYLPRVYKTGPLNRKRMIKVLMSRGKSKAQASSIVENIYDNEGIYDNTQTDAQINVPDSTRAVSTEQSFEQSRRLTKEDVEALDKAGLVETDIEGLMYKYVLDANKRVIGKEMADEINSILPKLKGATKEEVSWISDLYDATQSKYRPLRNKKVQGIQKWLLTGQYILTLPLAGLTALSEPIIILSRINPKYALFGSVNALYNSTRAGTRKFFPKMKMNEKEKAFAGILEGLDGSLAERFGDLANVTVARKVTNAFFRATLLTTVTQISRDMAFQATRMQMRNDLKTVYADKTKTAGYKNAKRRLLEQGITNPKAESVQSWFATPNSKAKDVTEGDPEIIRKALSKTVNEFIMAPNAVNRPLWMSDPHLASVAQLKGFAMVFGNTVGTRMWREIIVPLTKGRIPATDALKYGVALAGIMAMALAIQSLKDNIRYGDNPSPFDELDGKDKLLQALLRTNILGGFTLIYDAINAQKYGTNFIAAILGPTASTAEKGTSALYNFGAKGESRSLARFIADMIPILRNIPQARDIKSEVTAKTQDTLDTLYDKIVD
jgi:hypothetical protein